MGPQSQEVVYIILEEELLTLCNSTALRSGIRYFVRLGEGGLGTTDEVG